MSFRSTAPMELAFFDAESTRKREFGIFIFDTKSRSHHS
jgi:hypothetical protein